MHYTSADHTFAVCAYRESPYLEACIRSLERQTVRSRIIMCTATPCDYLRNMAEKHGIPLYVREGQADIAADWNFALSQAETTLVTLAHQDDLYAFSYMENVLEALNRCGHPLIAFTDYCEIRGKEMVAAGQNVNLLIKEVMLLPLRMHALTGSRWVRRRILSMGNAISCPTVTYVRDNLPTEIFRSGLLASLDWEAWEKLSRMEGEFCYIPRVLQAHRIHAESTTTKVIGNHRSRSAEDLQMLEKFWPEGIARLINHFYSLSQEGNQLAGEDKNQG